MNRTFGIFAFFVTFSILKLGHAAVQPFKPLFHTPNDFYLNGTECSASFPTVERVCPVFGVRYDGGSFQDVEALCRSFGFYCSGSLVMFRDGTCRSCDGGRIIYSDVDKAPLCEISGTVLYDDLVNPMDCEGSDSSIPRTNKGLYYPCYSNDQTKYRAMVERYSKGQDLAMELTMAACASQFSINAPDIGHTVITQNGLNTVMPFPVIGSLDQEYPEFGYLQCSAVPSELIDFAYPLWIFWYVFFSVTLLVCVFWAIYKQIIEDPKLRNGTNKLDEPSGDADAKKNNLEYDKLLTTSQIQQFGYKRHPLGSAAYASFVAFNIGLFILMLLVILDIFGMHVYTFCKDMPDVQESCRQNIAAGIDPSWREGYSCAAGCMYSVNNYIGDHIEWPYYPKSGGGSLNQVIFAVVWHITLICTVFSKMFQKYISTYFKQRTTLDDATIIHCIKPKDEEIISQKRENKYLNALYEFVQKLKKSINGKECDAYMYVCND